MSSKITTRIGDGEYTQEAKNEIRSLEEKANSERTKLYMDQTYQMEVPKVSCDTYMQMFLQRILDKDSRETKCHQLDQKNLPIISPMNVKILYKPPSQSEFLKELCHRLLDHKVYEPMPNKEEYNFIFSLMKERPLNISPEVVESNSLYIVEGLKDIVGCNQCSTCFDISVVLGCKQAMRSFAFMEMKSAHVTVAPKCPVMKNKTGDMPSFWKEYTYGPGEIISKLFTVKDESTPMEVEVATSKRKEPHNEGQALLDVLQRAERKKDDIQARPKVTAKRLLDIYDK